MKVVIYGFYNHQNAGDNLFCVAFEKLFPQHHFVFTDVLTTDLIQDASAIIIGGGSLLFDPINTDNFELLKTKTILYIGVGVEAIIHPMHLELMHRADLLAIRNPQQLNRIISINSTTILVPDLVYVLQSQRSDIRRDKSILILNNMLVVPAWSDPHWQHAAWSYFKSEFAQFLDALVEYGYNLKFLGMSQNSKSNDLHASIEIINSMKHRDDNYLLSSYEDRDLLKIISEYQVIITQRFHGIVLSELSEVPYMCIYHHDKLKPTTERGKFISYYGINKQNLLNSFQETLKMVLSGPLVHKEEFNKLISTVNNILGGA